jgi:hypothetical protein
MVFESLWFFGLFNLIIPGIGSITTPLLGVAGVYNDLY